MKTKLFFGAMAALMTTACSQDEMVCLQQDGITYSVAAGKQSRAADSYCNTALPASFKVWAKTADNAIYINGDKIVKGDGNPITWTDQDGTRYWPDGMTLDFFAEVNGDAEFDYNNGAPKFNNFTIKPNVADQLDLMYAVKTRLNKDNGTVQLNFRHALSQICFQARNSTKNLRVEINGVTVGHLANCATFTFPTESTDGNYVNHSDTPASTQLGVTGSWSTPAEGSYTNAYDVRFNTVSLEPGAAGNLTCPGENHVNQFANVMTLLPQTVNAWDPSVKGTDYNGAYFLVDLVLSNRVNKGTEASPVYEYVTAYSGKAAIPVEVNWEQGYRYIYTFVFDEGGNGGWTPDPNDPKPVLTTIKYALTVDDFIPVSGGDQNMNADESSAPKDETTFTLTLDANGGTGTYSLTGKGAFDMYSFEVPGGSSVRKNGYIFKGWANDETATDVTYVEGDVIILEKTSPSKTIYAVWEQDESVMRFVDLGLPSGTLWADRNLGATSVTDPGLYVGWGDGTGNMTDANPGAYPIFAPGYKPGYTKAENTQFGGLNGGYTCYFYNISKTSYDMAANLSNSDSWMPKASNFIELIQNTTVKTVTIDGVICNVYTSKKNSNSITIPFAGVKYGQDGIGYNNYFSLWVDQCFYIDKAVIENGRWYDLDNAVTFSNAEISEIYVEGAEYLYFIEKSYRSSIRPVKTK